MATIIWSTGEKYEKSDKFSNPKYKKDGEEVTTPPEVTTPQRGLGVTTPEEEKTIGELTRTYIFKESHKEEVAQRAGEREVLHQGIKNPFLSQNFIADLEVQEKFLKPQNSHFSK